MKLKTIGLCLPVVWLICFSIIHYQLNSHYFDLSDNGKTSDNRRLMKAGPIQGYDVKVELNALGYAVQKKVPKKVPERMQNVYEILPHDLVQLTGPWYWRFFHWGFVNGSARTQTTEQLSYVDFIKIPKFAARTIDMERGTDSYNITQL
jgi:hypothetical protein